VILEEQSISEIQPTQLSGSMFLSWPASPLAARSANIAAIADLTFDLQNRPSVHAHHGVPEGQN
jgi:hypothetical protein